MVLRIRVNSAIAFLRRINISTAHNRGPLKK